MAALAKPCRWCGVAAGAIVEEYRVYFVSCTVCGARGPVAARPEDAINSWNDGGAAMRKKMEQSVEEKPHDP